MRFIKRPAALALLISLASLAQANAGFIWVGSNGFANDAGNSLEYGVNIGSANYPGFPPTSGASNPATEFQGVTVLVSAFDNAGAQIDLSLSDITFESNTGGGQKFTTNRDFNRISIDYQWDTPWVTNQPNGTFTSLITGTNVIQNKASLFNNIADLEVASGWFDAGAQMDISFVPGGIITSPADGLWIRRGGVSTNVAVTIGTDEFSNGSGSTGDYISIAGTDVNANAQRSWTADSNLDPTLYDYDQNTYYLNPTGEYTDIDGNNAIRSGTEFGFTHNGSVLIPEPTTPALALLAGGLVLLRRKRG